MRAPVCSGCQIEKVVDELNLPKKIISCHPSCADRGSGFVGPFLRMADAAEPDERYSAVFLCKIDQTS